MGDWCSTLSAKEKHTDLSREDTQEHRQRINRGIADGRGFLRAARVGVSQGRWVSVGTGNHTHDREVVELELPPGDRSHDEDRNDGDDESRKHIEQSVTLDNGMNESCTGFDAYTGEEERESHLTKHHVGRGRGVGDELDTVSEAADEDSDDQRSAGETKLQRYRHTGDGDWDATEENTDDDTDEDRGDVWHIEATCGVTHQFCHTVDILLPAYDHDTVPDMEVVVA